MSMFIMKKSTELFRWILLIITIFYPNGHGVSLSSVMLVVNTSVFLNSSISLNGFSYTCFIMSPPYIYEVNFYI